MKNITSTHGIVAAIIILIILIVYHNYNRQDNCINSQSELTKNISIQEGQTNEEDIIYSDTIQTSPSLGFEAFKKHLNSTPLNKQYLGPDFASEKFKGYGESKYDKGLTFFDEISGSNIEEMRAKARQEEHKKIAINIVVGVLVIGLIVILLRRASYLKPNKDETNK